MILSVSNKIVLVLTCFCCIGYGVDNAVGDYLKVFDDGCSFEFSDKIDHEMYSWPRTLLSYPVKFETPIKANSLVLINKGTGREVLFQLSDVKLDNKKLVFAKVNFFSDLPQGGSRSFELRKGISRLKAAGKIKISDNRSNIEVDAGSLSLRVPKSQVVRKGKKVPGPVFGVKRDKGWIGTSEIISPKLEIERLDVETVEQGDLFASFRFKYTFKQGQSYTAYIKVIYDYDFIEFSEEMTGLTKQDNVVLEMKWTGYHPNRRFTVNVYYGFDTDQWHPIDKPIITNDMYEDPKWDPGFNEDPAKEMVITLLNYSGNGVREASPIVSFWDDRPGGQELGVFVLDHVRWQDHQYMVWQPSNLLKVRFRYADDILYWTWPLINGTRSTGINLVPAEDTQKRVVDFCEKVVRTEKKGLTSHAVFKAEEMRMRYNQILLQQYGRLSLNRVKDWVLEYPAEARQAKKVFKEGPAKSADDFEDRLFRSSFVFYPVGLNIVPGVNAIQHMFVYNWAADGYNTFHDQMTKKQRERCTALMLLGAYVTAGEELSPMITCVGGCPNMASEGVCVPIIMSFLFPEHPMAQEWRDKYEKHMELTGEYFTRPDVPAYESKGGRWTESLSAYNWTFMRAVGFACDTGIMADGKNRMPNPWTAMKGRWLVDMLSAPIYNPNPYWRRSFGTGIKRPTPLASDWKPGMELSGDYGFQRQYPAHGAHGSGTSTPMYIDAWALGHQLHRYEPLTAEHIFWASGGVAGEEVGKGGLRSNSDWDTWRRGHYHKNSGTNPHLKSCKYTGHGIVLRAGVDTPEELSIHLGQIDRGPNYRWGLCGEGAAGSIYFFANGKPYTGHEHQSVGDRATQATDGVTTFGVMKGKSYKSIGMNVLEKPLYDFGIAQFAEVVSRKGPSAYSWPKYLGRSIMLVGTDYFIIYDHCPGHLFRNLSRFSWFTAKDLEFPNLFFLKPMSNRHDSWTELTTSMSKGFHRDFYSGRFSVNGVSSGMVLVTHKDDVNMPGVSAEELPFLENDKLRDYSYNEIGRKLPNGVFDVETPSSKDRFFRDDQEIDYAGDGYTFKGTAGVVRHYNDGSVGLALFKGTKIGSDGVVLEVADAEIGISAKYNDANGIKGNYKAAESTQLNIRLSKVSVERGGLRFYVDGKQLKCSLKADALNITLPKGDHQWELCLQKPEPIKPIIMRTENFSAGAKLFYKAVESAEFYVIELSYDNGAKWERIAKAASTTYKLKNLTNGVKVHVRVLAGNSNQLSKPSNECPIYVTDQSPLPPDGLSLKVSKYKVKVQWGQVLGVSGYRLYRRKAGDKEFKQIYAGRRNFFIDDNVPGIVPPCKIPGIEENALLDMDNITVYEYAVACANGNGVGNKSNSESTDPRGWLVWQPDTKEPGYKRTSAYWLPPYVDEKESPPEYYPGN